MHMHALWMPGCEASTPPEYSGGRNGTPWCFRAASRLSRRRVYRVELSAIAERADRDVRSDSRVPEVGCLDAKHRRCIFAARQTRLERIFHPHQLPLEPASLCNRIGAVGRRSRAERSRVIGWFDTCIGTRLRRSVADETACPILSDVLWRHWRPCCFGWNSLQSEMRLSVSMPRHRFHCGQAPVVEHRRCARKPFKLQLLPISVRHVGISFQIAYDPIEVAPSSCDSLTGPFLTMLWINSMWAIIPHNNCEGTIVFVGTCSGDLLLSEWSGGIDNMVFP